MAHSNPDIEIAQGVIKRQIQGLNEMLSQIGDAFITTIETISTAKGRVFVSGMGKSGYIARKIAATMSSTGTPAVFIHPAEAGHGDLGMITSEDVVIMMSNSGETSELNPIIDYCKRFGIKIIGITRREKSMLHSISDIPICLPAISEASDIDAPTTSTTMMMVFGDAIAVTLQKRNNFTKEDFKIFHPGGNIGARLMRIEQLMHTDDEVPLVKLDENGVNIILTITQKRLGCTGVINDSGELVGVITDGDLRRHMSEKLELMKASDIMTKEPLTATSELFASKALALMNQHSITNMFIVENGKPIGALHMHDLLRAGVV